MLCARTLPKPKFIMYAGRITDNCWKKKKKKIKYYYRIRKNVKRSVRQWRVINNKITVHHSCEHRVGYEPFVKGEPTRTVHARVSLYVQTPTVDACINKNPKCKQKGRRPTFYTKIRRRWRHYQKKKKKNNITSYQCAPRRKRVRCYIVLLRTPHILLYGPNVNKAWTKTARPHGDGKSKSYYTVVVIMLHVIL